MMNPVFILIFLSMLALFIGVGAMIFSAHRREETAIKERVATLSAPGNPSEVAVRSLIRQQKLSSIPLLHRMLTSFNKTEELQRIIYQAGNPFNLGTLVLLCSVLAILGFLFGAIQNSWKLGLLLAPLGGCLPYMWLSMMRNRRLKAFDEQFPETVDMIARSLRAGHSFSSALKMVAEELDEPVSGEFARTFDDYAFGKSMSEALVGLAERVDLQEVKFFVTAVSLQRETGGNLTEILDNIGHIIRERFRLQRQVRALSAEGRLSGIILSLMPPTLLGLLYMLSPGYLQLLFGHPLGKPLLITGAIFQVTGILVIKKIISLKV